MPFNSVTFAIFLPLTLAIYWSVPARRRNLVLVVASYVFYGWWDYRFLSLLALSTLVDYTVGRRLAVTDDASRRKRLLLTSVAVNLGVLGTFKYLDFFSASAADALSSIGFEPDTVTLGVILPVGISFYTFQTISYSFDVYRRRIEPTRSLVDFACYVAYFPQLVAGPIERARRLLPQIADYDRRPPSEAERWSAFYLILMGLAKKVVLADGVAGIVDEAFDDPAGASGAALTAGVVAFAVQIYGDFSGYTDIARGVSRLLGIELVVNFTEPYLSRNITEFWRRWHISLSDWLRDYLYIPLGGNRHGVARTYRNLMITMLLGGLWHGASWNFVVWGGLHGGFLVVHRLLRGGSVPEHEPRLRDLPSIALTALSVLGAWVFFRAPDLATAGTILAGIARWKSGWVEPSDVATVALFAVATLSLDLAQRRGLQLPHADHWAMPVMRGMAVGSVLVVLVLFSGGTPVPFIYFQF